MATEWSDSITVSQLADEPALSEELNALADRLLESDPVPHLVMNLASVTYLNSSNIAQLLRIRKIMEEADRQLRLCSVADEIMSIMLVTGLDKVFRFAPDLMTALAGIQIEDEPH